MRQTAPETQVIMDVIKNNPLSPEQKRFLEENWKRVLKKASHNRVLYIFSKNISEQYKKNQPLQKIIREGEEQLTKLKNTLLFINKCLSKAKIRFIVVKTYKYLPYVTFDVDVFVHQKDFEKTKRVLRENGAETRKHPGKQSANQVNCFKKGLLKIDLHQDFSWQGERHIDTELVWKNTRQKQIQGVRCPIPSKETEIILNLAHVLFERRYLSILDFIFFKNACKENPNTKKILKQSKKNGWTKSFLWFAETLNQINKILYPEDSKRLFDLKEKTSVKKIKKFEMPYMFPLTDGVRIFWEQAKAKKYLPKFDFAYYFFTTFRYYLTNKKRLPYYLHWFKF